MVEQRWDPSSRNGDAIGTEMRLEVKQTTSRPTKLGHHSPDTPTLQLCCTDTRSFCRSLEISTLMFLSNQIGTNWTNFDTTLLGSNSLTSAVRSNWEGTVFTVLTVLTSTDSLAAYERIAHLNPQLHVDSFTASRWQQYGFLTSADSFMNSWKAIWVAHLNPQLHGDCFSAKEGDMGCDRDIKGDMGCIWNGWKAGLRQRYERRYGLLHGESDRTSIWYIWNMNINMIWNVGRSGFTLNGPRERETEDEGVTTIQYLYLLNEYFYLFFTTEYYLFTLAIFSLLLMRTTSLY